MIVLLQNFIIFILDMNIHDLFTFLRIEQQKDLYIIRLYGTILTWFQKFITFSYSLYKQHKRKRAKTEYITVDSLVGLI